MNVTFRGSAPRSSYVILMTIFVLLATPFTAAKANQCLEIFTLKSEFFPERNMDFSQFSIERFSISGQVFRVTTPDNTYLLRMGSPINDIPREKLIYDIVTQKLGLNTPYIEPLSGISAYNFIRALSQNESAMTRETYKRANLQLRGQPMKMSLAEWNPHLVGGEYIKTQTVINDNIYGQLANWWVATAVLGIHDFHSHNWMTDGQTVWGIDLAIVYEPPTPGQEIFNSSRQGPLGLLNITNEQIIEYAKAASPKLITDLVNITRAEYESLAQGAGYKLAPNEFETFQTRLQIILDIRK